MVLSLQNYQAQKKKKKKSDISWNLLVGSFQDMRVGENILYIRQKGKSTKHFPLTLLFPLRFQVS